VSVPAWEDATIGEKMGLMKRFLGTLFPILRGHTVVTAKARLASFLHRRFVNAEYDAMF
jgi:hypothetical protein